MPPVALLVPVLAFVLAGYVLPSVLLLALSAGHEPSFALHVRSLTLTNYARLLDWTYLRILGYTILLGVLVGCTTAVFGYPVAYYLARSRSRSARTLFFLVLTPMAVGINMLTLGWMIVLGKHGFVNAVLLALGVIDEPLRLMFNWTGVVIGMTHVTFTFMVLPIASVLRNVDPSLERAARNLGARPWQALWYVTLPLSLEGVAAGFLIVFMLSAGAFVLPLLMGGEGFIILPILVWEQVTVANDKAFGAAIALALLAVTTLILWLQLRHFRTAPAARG